MAYSMTTQKTWAQTRNDLVECFNRWGVKQWEITSELQGAEAANWSLNNRKSPEVLVTFTHPKTDAVVPVKIGSQARAVDNLRVCYLVIDSVRLNEVRGIGDAVQQVYLALPSPAIQRDPYEVLGTRSDSDMAVVEASFKALRKKYHPDTPETGNAERFKELEVALESIKKERGS